MWRRQPVAIASVVFAVVGLVALMPDCASACSCGGSKEEIVEWALSHPGAVFSGKVIDIERGSFSFRVNEVWKGQRRETLQVSTPNSGAACVYPFENGQEYLVFAYWGNQGTPPRPGLKVDLCGSTKPLSLAGAELALLGDGETPEAAALNDTSGAVSVRATVLIAVLAMAASFSLVTRLG